MPKPPITHSLPSKTALYGMIRSLNGTDSATCVQARASVDDDAPLEETKTSSSGSWKSIGPWVRPHVEPWPPVMLTHSVSSVTDFVCSTGAWSAAKAVSVKSVSSVTGTWMCQAGLRSVWSPGSSSQLSAPVVVQVSVTPSSGSTVDAETVKLVIVSGSRL
jgi:hypothetical protein